MNGNDLWKGILSVSLYSLGLPAKAGKSLCSLLLDYIKLINLNGHKEENTKVAMKYAQNKHITYSIKPGILGWFTVEPTNFIQT